MTRADGFAPFALERWFASLPRAARYDLAGSAGPPISLRELLGHATPRERAEFTSVPLGYGPPTGSPELRRLVAERYVGVDPQEVLVTCGAIEALHLAVGALVEPDHEVVVQEPMYPAVAGIAHARGARVVAWRLDADRAFCGSLDSLTSLLGPRTRVVAITQPNGPTGSILDAAELDRLAALLAPRGIWLLSDEVYRELPLEPGLAVPSAVERYRGAVSVGDVSKPYGLGGLRIGWLVTHQPEVRERITALRDYTTLSVPTLGDFLARVALRHHAALVARPIANARSNVAALALLAARDHALSFSRPRAGLTAFVRVAEAPRIQRELYARGTLVVPGGLFGYPDWLRVGLSGPTAEFAAAVAELARVLPGRAE